MTSSKIYSSIHLAAAHGSASGIDEWLIDDPSLLNSVDHSGWTPLHTAAFYQKETSIVLLLQRGAATRLKNKRDQTPLKLCMRQGYSESFRLLCDAEKQDYLKTGYVPTNSKGNTIVHQAAYSQGPLILKEMLSFCDPNQTNDLGRTVLSIAADSKYHETISLLLNYPHFVTPISQANKDQALQIAVSGQHLQTTTLLLEHHANPQTCDVRGWSLLHCAVELGNIELTELLILHGADIHFQHSTRVTALHIAAKHQEPTILDLLLSHGAQVCAKTNQGVTPLHLAAHFLREKAVRSLVQAGADLQIQDCNGQTPLHNAAAQIAERALNTVQYLVESGAPLELEDVYGRTPLGSAKLHQGHTTVYRYLEEAKLILREKEALISAIDASMSSRDDSASSPSLSPSQSTHTVTHTATEEMAVTEPLIEPSKDLLGTSLGTSPPSTTRRL